MWSNLNGQVVRLGLITKWNGNLASILGKFHRFDRCEYPLLLLHPPARTAFYLRTPISDVRMLRTISVSLKPKGESNCLPMPSLLLNKCGWCGEERGRLASRASMVLPEWQGLNQTQKEICSSLHNQTPTTLTLSSVQGMQNTFAVCSTFSFIVSSFSREVSSDNLINSDPLSLRLVSSKRYCIKRQQVAFDRCSMTGAIPVTTMNESLVCTPQESDRHRRGPCKESSCHEATACFHSLTHTKRDIRQIATRQ